MLMLPDFRVRQRDFLLQILRAITAQLDLTEVLRRVLHASVAMMAGKTGLIALRAPDGYFYVRAYSGIDPGVIPQINAWLHDLIAGLHDDDSPEILNEKLREMAETIDDEVQQSIALPLAFAGEPLGLLIVFRSYRSSVSLNDLQVLQSFADQAAIAVHNAQLYEAIDQERTRLMAILGYSADGVMILDRDLTILHFNPSLERMTGWGQGDAVGSAHEAVIVWHRLESGDLREALDAGWPFNTSGDPLRNTLYVEGDLVTRSGLTLSVGITYAPMLSADGRLSNIVANARDITNFRKAQEMQNVFISTISHELKTPVALIKGYAATLRREDAIWDQAVLTQSLGVIEDEADRLTDLIEDLLTASKIQAQRALSLNWSELALDQLAERAVERLRSQSSKHQFALVFPAALPLVWGDEARLRQVLDNLITNAIKYSPNGGTITVGGEADDSTVTVYVRDQGVGIAEAEQARIFDRFYRVDDKLSRSTKGTGLGLYLAKAIIDAHRGVIGVHSTLGEGSTFFFTIPLGQ
jgi:PAS domain S-box-containing protein